MDFVIQSPDLATLQADAQSMGFYDATSGEFLTQGRIPGDDDPYSSYFLNIVGTVTDTTGAAQPGIWGRLRINGSNPFASGLLTTPASLTVYALVTPSNGGAPFWASDGATPAPAFVAAVGVIA